VRDGANGRLTRRLPFPVDPDWAIWKLGHVLVGVWSDATLLLKLDAAKIIARRMRLVGILARHFRIPPDYWDAKTVHELEAWFEEMIDMAAEEKQAVTID
jgi:hypothetical protein